MLGGIAFNTIFAYFVFILLMATGLPKTPLLYPKNAVPVITKIAENSAAARDGLKTGDEITAIDNIAVDKNVEKLISLVQPKAGESIAVSVIRENQPLTILVIPDNRETIVSTSPTGSLGVTFEIQETQGVSFGQAIIQGINITNYYIAQTFKAFANLFTQRKFDSMASPLMIISVASTSAAAGFKIFLILLAIISLNLAILNLIPLPIFDGGQILFFSLEALIGKPLPYKVREYIHIGSWAAILVLTVFLVIKDITHIASPHIESVLRFLGFKA